MEQRLLKDTDKIYIYYVIYYYNCKLKESIRDQLINNFIDHITNLKLNVIIEHRYELIDIKLTFKCLNEFWNIYNNNEIKDIMERLKNMTIFVHSYSDMTHTPSR